MIYSESSHYLVVTLPSGARVKVTASQSDLQWLEQKVTSGPNAVKGQQIPDGLIDNEWVKCKKGSIGAFRHAVRWSESIHGVQS